MAVTFETRLVGVQYEFDTAGEMSAVKATVRYQMLQDGRVVSSVDEERDITGNLNAAQRSQANAFGKRARELVES